MGRSTRLRTNATASGPRRPIHVDLAQVSSTGATNKSPSASPDHHTIQRRPTALRSATPLAHRLVTPIVALSVVLTAAARITRASTSRSRSSEGRKAARLSSQTAVTASSAFPPAMPAAPASGTPAVQLSRNAPSAIPGQ